MPNSQITAARARLATSLGRTFGLRKGTLDENLRRAGRHVPREVREHIRELDRVEMRTAHPRRRGQVNSAALNAAERRAQRALAKIDLAKDRARARINWLGTLVINLLIFAVGYSALIYALGIL